MKGMTPDQFSIKKIAEYLKRRENDCRIICNMEGMTAEKKGKPVD
jgi:hypothetical protein